MHHSLPLITTLVGSLVLAFIFGMLAHRLRQATERHQGFTPDRFGGQAFDVGKEIVAMTVIGGQKFADAIHDSSS